MTHYESKQIDMSVMSLDVFYEESEDITNMFEDYPNLAENEEGWLQINANFETVVINDV